MENRRVLLLGGSGLLGAAIEPYLSLRKYEVTTAGRSLGSDYSLEASDPHALKTLINEIRPKIVMNLIAATDVDACECDVPMAFAANALIPGAISTAIEMSTEPGIHLVHISTDQVYDGRGNHKEDYASPVNVYGLTKLAGELLITTPNASILRTNFFGKSHNSRRVSFSDWIYNAFQNSEKITLFDDVIFSALHVSSLCKFIDLIIQNAIFGTFNLGCRNGISKAGFALSFAEKLNLRNTASTIGKLADYPFKARRPMNMTMDIAKLEQSLGIKCPDIFDEINKAVKEYEDAKGCN